MSIRLEVPLSGLKEWLESQTAPLLAPVQVKAERLLKGMREAHITLIEACKMLVESSRKEIEKRNPRTFKRAQALNKLAKLFLERLEPLKIPEKPSFKDVEGFVGIAQKAYTVIDVDVRSWFPRISPFFIMDRGKFLRAFEDAKASLKELSVFLTREYVKAKTLEETFHIIEEMRGLKVWLASLLEKCEKIEKEKASLEEELAQARRRIVELERGGELAELVEINEAMECLRREVTQSLRHVQKPLVKLQSLALHGSGGGLTPEELKKLSEYLADPFEALATEDVGYPLLRRILQKTARAMSEGKLKLKDDKERKAKHTITEIVEKNSLVSLHSRCVEARNRKTRLSASLTVAKAKTEMAKLRERMEGLQKRLEGLESEIAVLRGSIREATEKMENRKSLVEKNILGFCGREVVVTI